MSSVDQFLYQAWITDPKAALKARGKDRRKFWKKYTKRVKHRKSRKKGEQILALSCISFYDFRHLFNGKLISDTR